MIAGVSGIGKTTIARWISAKYNLPFRSGSFTTLVKSEEGKTHQQILQTPLTTEQRKSVEFELLTQRVRLVKEGKYVTDRSFLDSAAYYILKLASETPTCEVEDYISLCYQLTAKHCTHLILVNYSSSHYHKWEFENNDLRILNKWFQLQVGNIMGEVLQYWDSGINKFYLPKSDYGCFNPSKIRVYGNSDLSVTYHSSDGHSFKCLVLNTIDFDTRNETIQKFLSE